jgi:hypothetical protein
VAWASVINKANASTAVFRISNCESGATANFTITDTASTVQNQYAGPCPSSADFDVMIDVSSLNDGDLTLSLWLTDSYGMYFVISGVFLHVHVFNP